MAKIQAIRGMNDILPEETPVWQFLEERVRSVMHRYGYREIRFPVVELTQLFRRSIGEVTDIVEKEMYTFDDRNGDSLSLRPEGTAGCVRAAEQHGLLYNQQQRFWYHGPMFRHERPQKGRYRQFHQFGVEAFGMVGPDIDAEVILLSARLWRELGLSDVVRLEINNIGSAANRVAFGTALKAYLSANVDSLDADSRRRLDSNPLRILDSKVPETRALLVDAPRLADFLDEDSRAHFEGLRSLLDRAGVETHENPTLVRGLDYYNYCVFEWTTESLGAQGTVCAGGRYDGLVEQLGGRATPAVGFALGEERLVLLLEAQHGEAPPWKRSVDVFVAITDPSLVEQGLLLAETLRERIPALSMQVNCGGGKYNSQMKKAFHSGARAAVVLQVEDAAGGTLDMVRVRLMDDRGETSQIPVAGLESWLRELISP